MSDTANITLSSVRQGRREIRASIAAAINVLTGSPGLSVEDQIANLHAARTALDIANLNISATIDLIKNRDNAAWQEEKNGRLPNPDGEGFIEPVGTHDFMEPVDPEPFGDEEDSSDEGGFEVAEDLF